MSLRAQAYQLGRLVDAIGGGTAPHNLTNSYTPGSVMSTVGLGAISGRATITVPGGGATKIYVRLMDYKDPSSPRALQWTRMDTGVTQNVHEFAASATLDFQTNLGGVVPMLAVEKKNDGVAGAGDTVVIEFDAFDAA